MTKISMPDEFGEEHVVDDSELIDRTSAYGIYLKDGKVLMVQDKNSKTWEFPGGGLEEGETKKEGLVREYFEETGLNIDPKSVRSFNNTRNYFYSTLYKQAWNSLRYFYFIDIKGGELLENGNGDDTISTGYFTKEEALKVEIKPKIREIVDEVFKR